MRLSVEQTRPEVKEAGKIVGTFFFDLPTSRSAAEQIKALRQQASGKFISASYAGVYQFQETAVMARTGRAFRTAES